MGIKMHNFIWADFKPLKFFWKIYTKNYKQNKSTNMSKSEKVHISITFLLLTFSYGIFSTFQRIQNQHQICVFWYHYCIFQKIKFLDHVSPLKSNTEETAQINEKFILQMCQRSGRTRLLKSLYPNVQLAQDDSLEIMRPEHTVVRAGEPADE